jgi:hypothetical protein
VIDFRYHVVSIIAVFLALTVGLVIGASVINQDSVALLQREYNDANNAKLNAQQQLRDLQGSASQQEQYIDETSGTLTSDQLVNKSVAVVQIAGANSAAVTSTSQLISKSANAGIGIDLTVNTSFSDSNYAGVLNQLVSTCTPGNTPISGSGAVAAMQLLTAAITASTQGTEEPNTNPSASASATPSSSPAGCGPQKPANMTPSWALTTLDAYQGQGVITVNSGPSPTGTLVAAFIAAPDQVNSTAQNNDYLALAESLHADGVGPVVGGTSNSAQAGGLIAAVLADSTAAKNVYTVDDTDRTMGQVAVVFVMVQVAADAGANAGHYGLVGSNDGLLPALPSSGASG